MLKHKLLLFAALTVLNQASASNKRLIAFMTGRKIDPKHADLCKKVLIKIGAPDSLELSKSQERDFLKKLSEYSKIQTNRDTKASGREARADHINRKQKRTQGPGRSKI